MNRAGLAHLVPRAFATLGLGGGLLVASCGAPSPASDASRLRAEGVVADDGVGLTMACVPSGIEICFNAVDDNCNGVIDEGCGVATGVLQFTIAWGDSPADVDLVVTDPKGARIHEGAREAPSGLRLDKDCPGEDGCYGQNIENVVFEGLDPPKGKYLVEVKLGETRGARLPVEVRFGARVGSRTFSGRLALEASQKRGFSFELR